MTDPQHQALILELETDGADQIRGRLADPRGRSADFVGWLGLAGAIEELSGQLPDGQSRGDVMPG